MNLKTLQIVIFQYDLPLQSYSRDLATKLREMGADVEFFGFRLGDQHFVSKDEWAQKQIPFREFEEEWDANQGSGNFLLRIWSKIEWRWRRSKAARIFGQNLHFLDRSVLLQSYKVLEKKQYDLLIGIEKQGLIWAGMLAERFDTPYIYYSLELYLEDNRMNQHLGHFRKSECYFHRNAVATIIQDQYRAKALRLANRAFTPEVMLPVSVRGPENRTRTSFLRERLDLPENSVLLIYFGAMDESRLCHIIVEASDYLPENFVIVFHGYAHSEDYFTQLKDMAIGRRIRFSTPDLDEGKIDLLLGSADIGFALYLNSNVNDRFTAFSSQKIALFCRNGLPFISNRNESYEDLFQRFRCGEMASTAKEIADAAIRIHQSHGLYREKSFSAFSEIFDLDNQFQAVHKFIEAGDWKNPVTKS